uniref:RING-type domain-containing protein n=1 Tax=Oryza glumipatula TaxID=40148 RepID=A0A0D9YZG0_9ORYZ
MHASRMEQTTGVSGHEHIIDIPRDSGPSTSTSHSVTRENHGEPNPVDRPATRALVPALQAPSAVGAPSAGHTSGARRSDNYVRRHRSPLNSGLWISIEVLVNVSQIVAAIVVLSLSRKEHPQAPLFEWVIGYTVGCFATLPHLYWRYIHRNIVNGENEPAHTLQGSSQNNSTEPSASASERRRNAARNAVLANPRINALFDHFKMALDCFFAVWFVVGNVWIFGGRSSAADAPNLYRLCIVFLTFSCIGYAMPFILCAMICCCLPCIISVMGFREDTNNTRGATSESINSLPTYKFKTKKRRHSSGNEAEGQDGGIVAAGTDKERSLSAEDAVCCICLAKYAHNDELRELPCTHCFHKECVDKWLKINALCPLCKSEIASSSGTSDTRRSDHTDIPVQEIEMH